MENTCGNYISSPNFVCSSSEESEESQALEVQDITTTMIYAAAGDNKMTYGEFSTYPPQVGIWSLNTPRNLQFQENCFFKSPTTPMSCSAEDCIVNKAIKALNDTTWGELALNVCAGYFPSGDTNITLGPSPEGQILVAPISKCQNMTFNGPTEWVLTDEFGNDYIMHASGANTTEGVDEAAKTAVFPEGWSVKQVDLDEPFTIFPDMDDEGNCYYTVVRDSSDNSYHMIGCSPGRERPTDLFDACPDGVKSSQATSSTDTSPPADTEGSPSSEPASSGVFLSVGTLVFLVLLLFS